MRLTKIEFNSERAFTCDITPKRTTDGFELEIYHSGDGKSYINGKMYPHKKNKIIFAKPNQERFSVGKFSCSAIHFTCSDTDLTAEFSKIPDALYIDLQTKTKLLDLFDKIDPQNNLSSLSALIQILCIIKTFGVSNTDNKTIPRKEILRVKEHIDQNFTSQIDLNIIAKQIYLSPNYIRKLFAGAYGFSIQQYIIDMRLSYVKKLIVGTDKSLCEIAYLSGFNSQSHMNYMFKSTFGLSPLAYKQQFAFNSYNSKN